MKSDLSAPELQILGLVSTLNTEEQELFKKSCAEMKRITENEIGMLALTFVSAELIRYSETEVMKC